MYKTDLILRVLSVNLVPNKMDIKNSASTIFTPPSKQHDPLGFHDLLQQLSHRY